MSRIRTYILVALLTSITLRAVAQQTVQFSQYIFNGLALNPAYAGYKEDWTVNLSSRTQWVGISGAPQTETASVDGLLNSDNKNVGIGLMATVDKLGPESMSSVYANYAYRLRLDELDTKRLSFGIGFGVTQYSLNGTELNATDIGDNGVPSGSVSNISPGFRFGVYYSSPNVYFGASVFNLISSTLVTLTNDAPVINQARTLYLTGGTLIPLSAYIDFKPSVMIKEDFKGPTNVDLTGYLVLNKIIWLGTSYRTGVTALDRSALQNSLDNADAIAAIAQFYINDHFRVGYSYDFTTSKLAGYQSGTHELSLTISFRGKKPRVVSPRYF